MPRLAKTPEEKVIELVCRRIRHHYYDALRERNADCASVAKSYGFTYGTLANRFNSPGSFDLKELLAIAKAMKIPLKKLVDDEEDAV